jgi:hypothetical protein
MSAIISATITAAATITVGVKKDQTQKKANNAQIAALQADTKLQLLNSTQKQALDYRIANAQTDTDRLKAYEQAISSVSGATETSIGTIYAAGVSSASQQNFIQKSALIAGGIMLLGGTIYVLRKK